MQLHKFPNRLKGSTTEIDADFDGNAFAPTLSPAWREVQRESHVAANGLPFSFVTYQQ